MVRSPSHDPSAHTAHHVLVWVCRSLFASAIKAETWHLDNLCHPVRRKRGALAHMDSWQLFPANVSLDHIGGDRRSKCQRGTYAANDEAEIRPDYESCGSKAGLNRTVYAQPFTQRSSLVTSDSYSSVFKSAERGGSDHCSLRKGVFFNVPDMMEVDCWFTLDLAINR